MEYGPYKYTAQALIGVGVLSLVFIFARSNTYHQIESVGSAAGTIGEILGYILIPAIFIVAEVLSYIRKKAVKNK